MASGAPDIGENTQFQGAPGSNLVGDPMMGGSFNYGGAQMYMNNPAQFSPDQLNPSVAPYMNNIGQLQAQFGQSAAGGAFNPDFYQGMEKTSESNMTSSLSNQYAQMGLGGSSAEAGAMANAVNQNQMNWMNREQSDQLKALSGMEGLDKMGIADTMAVQGQYSNFEDSYNQSIANLLGLQNQAQASSNQLTGSLIGGGMQGGMMAAMLLA